MRARHLADRPEADHCRRRAGDANCRSAARAATIVSLPVELPVEEAVAELREGADDESALPEVGPEDDATILFTSGSTGEAKGARSTHRAVTTAIYTYATGLMVMLGLLTRGRPRAQEPAAHLDQRPAVPRHRRSAGHAQQLRRRPLHGDDAEMGCGRSAAADRAREGHLFRRRADHEPGADDPSRPPQIRSVVADRHRRRRRAAADQPCRAAAATNFPSAKPALGYGLTETNAVGCHNFWSNYADKPGSTGRAHRPYVELAILGEGDARLPTGQAGEIGIKSAANISGYWRNPEATDALFTPDGFVRTGDIGYLDEDGYLFIVDRKKDIIIRGGENISAAEVEAACYACPSVGEVSVFACIRRPAGRSADCRRVPERANIRG